MDVETMRPSQSSTEEQMDIVSMMMHMEKLPDDFYNPNSSTSSTTLHELHFSNNTLSTHVITSYPNLQATSPTYNNPNFNIPFMGTPPPLPFSSSQTPYMEKRNNSTGAIREMIFRVAAMQPIHIDPEAIKPPKRRNVKISKDPQSVAARHRRERISERIRILQRLVPGGTKMDTASMLDEAVHYVKFLKKQVQSLEEQAAGTSANNVKGPIMGSSGFGVFSSGVTISPNVGFFSLGKNCQPNASMEVGSMQMLR